MKLRVLDLFSGIGGFSLGLERTGGFETVAFCEYEPFPRAVLAKHWPNVPCFPDVRTLKGTDIAGTVDVICGGYPCQPFSTAGQRRGKEDDRHLWPEFNRLVAELRPAWVIGENVAGHISMGLDDVLSDLERQGYAARSFVIPACAVDAPHRRDRVWTVAHARHSRIHERGFNDDAQRESRQPRGMGGDGLSRRAQRKVLADAKRIGRNEMVASKPKRATGKGTASAPEHSGSACGWARWLPEPDVGRVADGVPRRVDRLKALGNAVVPQIPEMIGRAILAA